MEPASPSEADAAAARRALAHDLGWFADPLFPRRRGGPQCDDPDCDDGPDYPEEVRATKPVPEFTEEEKARLRAHPPDFFALNFYSAT